MKLNIKFTMKIISFNVKILLIKITITELISNVVSSFFFQFAIKPLSDIFNILIAC